MLAFDHVGTLLPPPSDDPGTLSGVVLAHLEAALRSPPPYPTAAQVLTAALATAAAAADREAALEAAREERGRVAMVEASKARVQGKEIPPEVQATLDDVAGGIGDDDYPRGGGGAGAGGINKSNDEVGAYWGVLDEDAVGTVQADPSVCLHLASTATFLTPRASSQPGFKAFAIRRFKHFPRI